MVNGMNSRITPRLLLALALVLTITLPASSTSVAAARTQLSKMSDLECAKLKASGENGPPEQQALLATAYAYGSCGVGKDAVQAAMLYQLAATKGSTTAQLGLADLYMRGEGVGKNELQAVTWIRKAADAGNGDAQAALGKAYEQGTGVPKDPQQALQWYQKGALSGNAESQLYLGLAYRNGLTGPKDNEEAIRWWRSAADGENYTAMAALGRLYLERSNAEETAQVLPLIKKSAESGDKLGQYEYGELLAYGLAGAPKDLVLARVWYQKSADQGFANAQDSVRDLDKLNALREREKTQPAGATTTSVRIDRTVTPQAVKLAGLGLDLQIFDAAQKWHAEVIVNGTDVLMSSKGTKIAISLVEDVPCKTKTEMFSPTVVPNRSYIPPGWYKNAGEQYSSGNYVSDLCFHYGSGLVSAMIISTENWETPVFRSVIPALDAVRVAAVDRWGEDHTEAVSDLVPFPSIPAASPNSSASESSGSTRSTTSITFYPVQLAVLGEEIKMYNTTQWIPHTTDGRVWFQTAENDLNLVFNEAQPPDCAEVFKEPGDSTPVPNNYASKWYKTALLTKKPGDNEILLCLDLKGKSLLAALGNPLGVDTPPFQRATNLLDNLATLLEEKLGKR